MTRKAQTYLTRIKAAGNIYDLQGVEIAFKQDSTLGWDDIDRLCKAADEKRYTLTNSEDTIRLKNLLFFRVKAEMDAYHDMSHAPESNTAEEIQRQRARFCSVWQVLEEAELVDEYDAWKSAGSTGSGKNPKELKGCFAFKPCTKSNFCLLPAQFQSSCSDTLPNLDIIHFIYVHRSDHLPSESVVFILWANCLNVDFV